MDMEQIIRPYQLLPPWRGFLKAGSGAVSLCPKGKNTALPTEVSVRSLPFPDPEWKRTENGLYAQEWSST